MMGNSSITQNQCIKRINEIALCLKNRSKNIVDLGFLLVETRVALFFFEY